LGQVNTWIAKAVERGVWVSASRSVIGKDRIGSESRILVVRVHAARNPNFRDKVREAHYIVDVNVSVLAKNLSGGTRNRRTGSASATVDNNLGLIVNEGIDIRRRSRQHCQ
jgi:hypothetical protein